MYAASNNTFDVDVVDWISLALVGSRSTHVCCIYDVRARDEVRQTFQQRRQKLPQETHSGKRRECCKCVTYTDNLR